jgi:DNA-binding response OmpR family regulator
VFNSHLRLLLSFWSAPTEPHILFVEDDADTRQMVQILLSVARFHVSVAERSKEALELIGSDHFDALLPDM